MRAIALMLGTICCVDAQSISVTAPTPSQVTSGVQYTLKSVCSGCPSLYSTEYDIDGELGGITSTAPYSFSWDTYYAGNGSHTITAIARDALNNVIATSPAISFSVENNLPLNTCSTACSDISVAGPRFSAGATLTSLAAWGIQTIGFTGSNPSTGTVCHSNEGAGSVSCTVGPNFAVFGRVQGVGTVTISDGTNGYTCDTTMSVNGNFSIRWCWVLGGSAGTYTFSVSGGTGGYLIYVIPLNGVTGVDTSVEADTSSVNITSPISLGFSPTPTELILAGSSWQGANRSPVPLPGYTTVGSTSGGGSIVISRVFSNIVPFGTMLWTVTSNGPYASSAKDLSAFVDGQQAFSTTGNTGNPLTVSINTAGYTNTPHRIVFSEFLTGATCPNCYGGTWNWFGGYETSVTFANPAGTFMALVASTPDVYLVSSGSNNAGTACTAISGATWASGVASCDLTGIDVNTDGSQSAAAISCSSSDTTVFTVSGACTVNAVTTAAGYGFATLTLTDTVHTGQTRTVNVWNLSANVVSHFNSNGTVRNGVYSAGNSIWHASMFGLPAGGVAQMSNDNYFATLQQAGLNTTEPGSTKGPAASGTSEATWDANESAFISGLANTLKQYGMHAHLIWDSYFRGTPDMFPSQYGQCSTFVTPCFEYSIQQWVNQGVVLGMSGVDEVSSAWGGSPLQGLATGGLKLGSAFTNITGNGSTCALTGVGATIGLNGAGSFLIVNSGNPALDYVAASNGPLFGVGSTSLTNQSWSCTLNGTISTGNASVEPYVAWTYNASGAACSPGGSGSTPCPYYVHYDVFGNIRNQLTAVTNYPALTWPTPAGSAGAWLAQWSGKQTVVPQGASQPIRMSDYWEQYWTFSQTQYLPAHTPLSGLRGSVAQVGGYYAQLPSVQLNAPVLQQTAGMQVDYTGGGGGYQVPIASCSGDTITFASPHGLANVLDHDSRVWIPNSNYGCNNAPATTLNGAITSGATSVTVASAGGVAAPAYMLLENEMIYCTTLSGNTFSGCLRSANQSGAAASHSNGVAVNFYQLDYVMSTPTATTMRLYASRNPQTINITSGTITVDDGTIYPACGSGVCWSSVGTNIGSQGGNITNWSTCTGNTWRNKRGHTFTVSGSAATFYIPWNNSDPCDQFNNAVFPMENFAPSTGGWATILANNSYVRGQSIANNSETGARAIFASHMIPLMVGAAGERTYASNFGSGCPDFFDRTGTWSSPTSSSSFSALTKNGYFFNNQMNSGDGSVFQAGPSSQCDYARTFEAWHAIGIANLMSERLIKFAFQARMPAPDLGPFFLTHATTSSTVGNALMIQSFADAIVSQTVTLTPYLVSGQSIIRECASHTGVEAVVVIPAGTASDTFAYSPGEFCAYLFPTNTAAESSEPVISSALADINNATKIVVQFAYNPMIFQPSIKATALVRSFDCGAGTCTLPVDRQIGTVYYRLVYLGANGSVLATSGVQTL